MEKIVWEAKCATHLQLVPEVKNEWMCASVLPMCLHGVFSIVHIAYNVQVYNDAVHMAHNMQVYNDTAHGT
jgi:hypothetical protein